MYQAPVNLSYPWVPCANPFSPSQMPRPKPKSKWESFAASKGIRKQKKMKRVFDEDVGDWVATYGQGKKMVEKSKDWMREVKESYVPKGVRCRWGSFSLNS